MSAATCCLNSCLDLDGLVLEGHFCDVNLFRVGDKVRLRLDSTNMFGSCTTPLEVLARQSAELSSTGSQTKFAPILQHPLLEG